MNNGLDVRKILANTTTHNIKMVWAPNMHSSTLYLNYEVGWGVALCVFFLGGQNEDHWATVQWWFVPERKDSIEQKFHWYTLTFWIGHSSWKIPQQAWRMRPPNTTTRNSNQPLNCIHLMSNTIQVEQQMPDSPKRRTINPSRTVKSWKVGHSGDQGWVL